MLILGDEPERHANIDKHGLDFAELTIEFFETSLVVTAKDGRLKALGRLADGSIAVIFATLGTEALSVISMRPASDKEGKLLP